MLNLVCDMDAIMSIAAEHNLIVVEDACQAVGLTWRGARVGSIGHIGVFSFQQNKNIQAGEGGAVLTNDSTIENRARMYHDIGSYIRAGAVRTSEPPLVGVNYRMPEISAAILRPQLRALDRKLNRMRARRAEALDRLSTSTSFTFRVCPHHDPSAAVGLVVYFDEPEAARAFATVPGISRLIDTGRHVYTNWESVRGKRPIHPALDPYKWAHRPVEIGPDTCPKTLAILERTCTINLAPDLPTAAYRLALRKMVR
jgi:dTDP-4-amino-4,6-dideoxygalactose transaminase